MELLFFLLKVFGISLSGALAPGPVTAAAIAMGSRNRFAGTLMALGHGVVEFPLMVLLIFGVGRFLKLPAVGIRDRPDRRGIPESSWPCKCFAGSAGSGTRRCR